MREAYAMKMWALVVSMFALQVAATAAAAAVAPPIAAWAPCPWGSVDCNVCVADAMDSINRLRDHGDAMGFQMDGAPDVIFDKHWQGVQRLMGGAGRHLAISRSLQDESIDVSFVIVEMASRNGEGLRFRSNRLDPDFPIPNTAPPPNDGVVVIMPHESGFTHAGGMQALGNVLAVPFEAHMDGHQSKVVFYDVGDPLNPMRLANDVDHTPLSSEAGTATLGKLANGHFLLVIGRAHANTLDFYVSTGTDLRTTAYEWFDTWNKNELTGGDYGEYEALNFVAQCDGALFLAGTHRNLDIIISGGEDFIDLFAVTNGTGNGGAIAKVAKKHLFCNGTCEFDAAGGVYVDPGGRLYVYGTKHDNDGVPVSGAPSDCSGPACSTQFAEFRPVPHGTCEEIEDGWAELYVDADFGGRSLMVDFVDRHLEDYANFDRAEDFEDRTSSVHWCIPPRAVFRLWQDKGPCGGSHVDLVGDGTFHSISNLASINFGDKASCAEWLGGPFTRAGA